MCELYYLDHFREAVDEVIDVDAAEELMRESKATMKIMSERTAKLMLDLAFNKITHMNDSSASKRLIRYTGELCRKAQNDIDNELDDAEVLKTYLEDHIGDN